MLNERLAKCIGKVYQCDMMCVSGRSSPSMLEGMVAQYMTVGGGV